MVRVTAPGKLVLIGEYAVLEGAPAAVMAVNRRARVEIAESSGGSCSVSAPGFAPEPAIFEIGDDRTIRWRSDAEESSTRFGLMESLLHEAGNAGLVDLKGLRPFVATLDTRAFFHPARGGSAKLGLGSSAALTVALTSALLEWSDVEGFPKRNGEWLQVLVELNRRMQGGLGSGIDVAASLLGGMIRYQLDDRGRVVQTSTRLSQPEDLHFAAVWTGRPAKTGDFLRLLAARRATDPQGVNRMMRRLGEISGAALAALETGRSSAFLATVDAFWDALDNLGTQAGMPILSDEHRQLRQVAIEGGASYKPSGAGGGDFGLVFAVDSETIKAVSQRASTSGFEAIDLSVESTGLTHEASPSASGPDCEGPL